MLSLLAFMLLTYPFFAISFTLILLCYGVSLLRILCFVLLYGSGFSVFLDYEFIIFYNVF